MLHIYLFIVLFCLATGIAQSVMPGQALRQTAMAPSVNLAAAKVYLYHYY